MPGWYATYWVKMLNDIEVLNAPDDNYWMKKAYRIPDTPHANVKPGEKGFARRCRSIGWCRAPSSPI